MYTYKVYVCGITCLFFGIHWSYTYLDFHTVCKHCSRKI